MTNKRRELSGGEISGLCAQVNNICPLSGKPLYERKNEGLFKRFEIAHIYPLNPTEEEEKLLSGEERLGNDPNDLDNLIPLRIDVHRAFDKPRTVEEYRSLVEIKKRFILEEEDKKIMSDHRLEADINLILKALHDEEFTSDDSLNYDAKKIEKKTDATLSRQTKRRIKQDVADYYGFIKKRFKDMESADPAVSEMISLQVRTYYVSQKRKHATQEKIFANIVSWLISRTSPEKRHSAEIVASYFVQNCEIFE